MARPLCDIYPPAFPRDKYDKPESEGMVRYFKTCGDLDENGKITEKGKSWGLTEDWLNGTETEEHYQKYRKDYAEYIKKYFDWLDNDGNPDNIPHLIERP